MKDLDQNSFEMLWEYLRDQHHLDDSSKISKKIAKCSPGVGSEYEISKMLKCISNVLEKDKAVG